VVQNDAKDFFKRIYGQKGMEKGRDLGPGGDLVAKEGKGHLGNSLGEKQREWSPGDLELGLLGVRVQIPRETWGQTLVLSVKVSTKKKKGIFQERIVGDKETTKKEGGLRMEKKAPGNKG